MCLFAVLATLLAAAPQATANHNSPVLVSTGPSDNTSDPVASVFGGAGMSGDGSRVFFTSSLHLVPGDEDGTCPGTFQYGPHPCADVYERSGGQTTLLSTGPTSGTGDAVFKAASDDGSRVFFETDEPLVPEDHNSSSFGRPNGLDVYMRWNGETTLISTGPRGNGSGSAGPATFLHASPDGTRVLFQTANPLALEDANTYNDVYEWHNGTVTLVSPAPPGSLGASYAGASKDGTRVFFVTNSRDASNDTDNQTDLYEHADGQTTLLSTGPSGGNGPWSVPSSYFVGASEDGLHVFFATQESLVPSDNDSCGTNPPNPCLDIYERSGGQTTLVSTGPNSTAFNDHVIVSHAPGVVSADGSTVYFETDEPLVASDQDGTAIDAYKWSGGQTTLVSTGPAGGNGPNDFAWFAAASRDGQTAYFRTTESLVASDMDNGAQDIYQRGGDTTTLISTGPLGGSANLPATIDGFGAGFLPDASRVFFHTDEALVPEDTNSTTNLYERFAGQVYLVPATAGGGGVQSGSATPDGRTVLFSSPAALTADDTNTRTDLYVATVGPYPRPKGASPLQISLVPAFLACASPNDNHGAPLAFGSCTPPTQASAQLTIGTPDSNGAVANSVGSARYIVRAGDPSTPANEADVAVSASITDVRRQGTLDDYTGEVQLDSSVQVTDRLNGPSQTEAATGAVTDFPLTVPCVATPSAATGGTCAAATTLNAITPGAIQEGKRSIWELGSVKVFDGGSDGLAATTPNTLFATQGVFVP